jgi:hypothetical protein
MAFKRRACGGKAAADAVAVDLRCKWLPRRLGVWRFRIGWDQKLFLASLTAFQNLLFHSLQRPKRISGRFLFQVYRAGPVRQGLYHKMCLR